MNEKELAELTIKRYKEDLENTFERMSFNRDFYDGHIEKYNAVHDRLKSCLIHKRLNAYEYLDELNKLDPSFERATFEASRDYPELFNNMSKPKKTEAAAYGALLALVNAGKIVQIENIHYGYEVTVFAGHGDKNHGHYQGETLIEAIMKIKDE
jgi:hypothetical protein